MKQFALVVFLACVAATLAAPRLEADPAKAKASQEKLKEAHQKCQSNPATSVDQQALKALRDGGEKPANYGAHALCISQNLGWQNADGSVNKDVVQSRAEAIFGQSPKLSEIVNECTQPQANAEETAIYLTRCYAKYSPRPSGAPPGH
ncbi:uncharacterized protein LOC115880508 [Sitophilus oryzae]|uniref:Uncharacterized protein LOC115880508 n=1 Tax=Sitophilus oryzae TaxID=7048 RepID=A0A6J2XSJ4_SITOR|nr:uncharacterized protein LOC115880508 [Sitophilus oryzae]